MNAGHCQRARTAAQAAAWSASQHGALPGRVKRFWVCRKTLVFCGQGMRGTSLVEVLLSCTLLGIVSLGTAAAQARAAYLTQCASQLVHAAEAGASLVEQLRAGLSEPAIEAVHACTRRARRSLPEAECQLIRSASQEWVEVSWRAQPPMHSRLLISTADGAGRLVVRYALQGTQAPRADMLAHPPAPHGRVGASAPGGQRARP